VKSTCESGNEPSCSIKCENVLDWLDNRWPLELMLSSIERVSQSVSQSISQ
jgi:hypothetical protein